MLGHGPHDGQVAKDYRDEDYQDSADDTAEGIIMRPSVDIEVDLLPKHV